MEEESSFKVVRISEEVFDPGRVEGGGTANQTVDLVTLLKEKLGEVRAVLAGDAGHERTLHGSSGFESA